jgi:hypothetical protein
VAEAGVPLLVVKHWAYRQFGRDFGGDRRARQEQEGLANDVGRPIGLNLEKKDGGSATVFLSPEGWSQERLQGWLGGYHQELERELDSVARV